MSKNIWLEGMMGLVIGDALGMPVQFCSREALKKRPITGMRGYGSYNMPAGTWSDDSSMALVTLDSLQEKKSVHLEDIMQKFVLWLYNGEYTPYGEAFDEGNTCVYAISKFKREGDVATCGKTGEYANGNGALMRIMPMCLYAFEAEKAGRVSLEEAVAGVHQVTALTHNHLRAKIASGIYYFMIKALLETEGSLKEKLQTGIMQARDFYVRDADNHGELAKYERLFHPEEFEATPEERISSSGYVVHSLEAAVWSLLTTNCFEEALLKVVNLGDDADTVGAIAGGLAALYYGYESIPKEWLEVIVKRDWIEMLCNRSAECFRS